MLTAGFATFTQTLEPEQLYLFPSPTESYPGCDYQSWHDLALFPKAEWDISSSMFSGLDMSSLVTEDDNFFFPTLSDSMPGQSKVVPAEADLCFEDGSSQCSVSDDSLPSSHSTPSSDRSEDMSPSSSITTSDASPVPPSSKPTRSLFGYGVLVTRQNSGGRQKWRCAYPECKSTTLFTRGCDLRKHYKRHFNTLFCRVEGCPQSLTRTIRKNHQHDDVPVAGVFSSEKDRSRHEAKHSPHIECEWFSLNPRGCRRIFSRKDNMKDHVRRIHLR